MGTNETLANAVQGNGQRPAAAISVIDANTNNAAVLSTIVSGIPSAIFIGGQSKSLAIATQLMAGMMLNWQDFDATDIENICTIVLNMSEVLITKDTARRQLRGEV